MQPELALKAAPAPPRHPKRWGCGCVTRSRPPADASTDVCGGCSAALGLRPRRLCHCKESCCGCAARLCACEGAARPLSAPEASPGAADRIAKLRRLHGTLRALGAAGPQRARALLERPGGLREHGECPTHVVKNFQTRTATSTRKCHGSCTQQHKMYRMFAYRAFRVSGKLPAYRVVLCEAVVGHIALHALHERDAGIIPL